MTTYSVIINGKIVKEGLTLEEAMGTIADIKQIVDNFQIVKVIYEDKK